MRILHVARCGNELNQNVEDPRLAVPTKVFFSVLFALLPTQLVCHGARLLAAIQGSRSIFDWNCSSSFAFEKPRTLTQPKLLKSLAGSRQA